ncbi:MAG: pitrilysin family protein [Chitinophagaceae bacterium]
MKKYIVLLAAFAIAGTAQAQKLDRSIRPKAEPAPKIELGKTETFTLPNGMKVFVVENHKVPLVSASIELDIRPDLQGDQAGFHDIVGQLLTSGTKTKSKDQIDLDIDNIGATIRADEESMYGKSLTRSKSELLALMADIAKNADFKQTELDKLKKQTLSGLAAAKNNPDAMLKNVTDAVNYGFNHPFGEVATEKTVENITLDRCDKYYQTYWRPNVAYMALVGDITLAEVKPLIEKYFGSWEKKDVPVATYKVPESNTHTKVAFTAKDPSVQSVFNVTYPLELKPGNPDVIKASVANAILGGGSQGRLFLNLRETHGWTYGSYSSIHQDDLIGNFTAYAKCRNAVTDSAITQTLVEMAKMRKDLVSKEDLGSRISYLTGNFAIGLENPQTVAQFAINIERYKMPKDYYTNYLKNLAAVTPEDVQKMAVKYINPETANIVVVGSNDIAKTLEKFGPVSNYDNYGQPAVAMTVSAVPANVTAESIRKNYITAVGGEAAINSVKNVKTVYQATVGQGMQLSISEFQDGKNLKREVAVNGNTVQKSVYADGKGFMEAQGQKRDMTAEELEEAKMSADLQAILHPETYGITRTVAGVVKGDNGDEYEVDTKEKDGTAGKEYYDVKTGLLMKQNSVKKTPQGEVPVSIQFMDYKEVPGANGFKIPYEIKRAVGPQEFDAKLTEIAVNKGVASSEFK